MKRFSSIHFLRLITVCGLLHASAPVKAQLIIDQRQNPTALVQNVLLGTGVFPSNVMFNGRTGSQMAITDSIWGEIGRFNGANTSLELRNGIFLCTNKAERHLPGPNDSLMVFGGGYRVNPPIRTPDMDLAQLTGRGGWSLDGGNYIYSSSILEFDFIPINDMVSFRYVFSSEEYERWACSEYNDAFGWFISGPGISGPFQNNAMNIAFVPGSMAPVCINSVNSGLMNTINANGPWTEPFEHCFDADPNWQANAQYYRYNGGQWPFSQPPGNVAQLEAPYNNDPYYIAHNGMTVVLTASAAVQVGQTYHIKMGVGNVMDNSYPSAVFIEGGSFACGDRFTLSVDEGPNVSTSGTDPVLFESDTDSIHLRFNRWGGFYLDEHLRIAVEGSALADVDYMPMLPDSIHFNQLDSAVVVPIAIPVRSPELRELTIHLITSNGDKVMTYDLIIAPEILTGVEHVGPVEREQLVVFPNPANNILHVALPTDTKGRTELQVLDMAGRVVAEQMLNGASKATFNLEHLPDGLYILKATHQGKIRTTHVSVQYR